MLKDIGKVFIFASELNLCMCVQALQRNKEEQLQKRQAAIQNMRLQHMVVSAQQHHTPQVHINNYSMEKI